jgi:hypothetical protein
MALSQHRSGYLLQSLVLLVASAMLVSLVGCDSAMSEEEQAALKKVHSLGGKVNNRAGGLGVDFSKTDITDEDLANLKHVKHLKEVNIRGTRVTNSAIEDLRKQFPDLKVVR